MENVYLCKCNNCDTIMVDENPQVDAPMFPMDMKYSKMEFDKIEFYPICPICLVDDYLTDITELPIQSNKVELNFNLYYNGKSNKKSI